MTVMFNKSEVLRAGNYQSSYLTDAGIMLILRPETSGWPWLTVNKSL